MHGKVLQKIDEEKIAQMPVNTTYPVIFLRVKAAFIDSTVLGALLFLMVFLAVELGITDTKLRVLFILLPVVLFEPLMVWITGGSIGHHFSGIRVIGKKSGKNLFLLNGIVRLLVKIVFGVFSLAIMFLTRKHQSLHDFLSNSVVVFKDEAAVADKYKLTPRETLHVSEKPSVVRRLIVIVAYWAIATFGVSLAGFFAASQACINSNRCTAAEETNLALVVGVYLIVVLLVLALGLLCKLPGAYYRATKSPRE